MHIRFKGLFILSNFCLMNEDNYNKKVNILEYCKKTNSTQCPN